tara:strand:- start:106 stop:1464 length:1359 start_codon:yes stop_codon:yes gene_type:complete
MKYWGVALAFAALISVNAEASMSSLFHQLLKSLQNSHSIKNEQSAPDSGDEDSAGGSSDGSSNSGESGYSECMESVSGSYDTRCMLTALADEVIIPSYAKLATEARKFSAEDGVLANYCAAITSAGEAQAFSAAEAGWKDLAKAVQRAEMHAIGPATDNGKALQYRLNSYMAGPISTCGIDSIAAGDNVDVSARSPNARGIRALDYLLFNSDLKHTCAPQVSVTTDWNDLPESDRKIARCNAAVAITGDISDAAEKIHSAWSATGGNYRATYLEPSNTFQSLQATTDSLFYFEKGTKDAKLGKPLGIIAACANRTCPESVEAPYSGMSLQNVITNIEIFTEMFSSNAETGFDAHLENEGWPEVSQAFKSNLARAKELAESIDSSVASQVAAIQTESDTTECTNAFSNPDTVSESLPMCTLYGLVKRVVDSLKIDFVTIVNVDIPGGSQSDND